MSKAWAAVLIIVFIAATPGIMESYISWQQYPESRKVIVIWYVLLFLVALFGSGALARSA